MQEYGGEAIVLRKEPLGEQDNRVSFFSKRFGKLVAKAKSARKITSKLSAHLEPGNISEIRLVEKNEVLIVDALKKTRLSIPPSDLYLLDRLLGEGEADIALWHAVRDGQFSWQRILALLGWDPQEAACSTCSAMPWGFHIPRQDFFCVSCASNMPRRDIINVSIV